MATIRELRKSQSTQGNRGTYEYAVTDNTSWTAAKALLLTTAPATAFGLWRQIPSLEYQGGGVYLCTVPYGPFQTPEDGNAEWNLRIGTKWERRQTSLQTMETKTIAGRNAVDFQKAVNVTKDRVEGVDVPVPTFDFDETHYIAAADFTTAYLNTLYATTGHTNDGVWRIFTAEEVLLLGVTGAPHDADLIKLVFSFSAEPTVAGLQIGNCAAFTEKRGWWYAWAATERQQDTTGWATPWRVFQAQVERMITPVDFDNLLLPNPF